MDISRRKQMEAERLEKEKLLSIIEMTGAISHELNNPLQVALTCAEKLALRSEDAQRNSVLIDLLKSHIEKMSLAINKFQNITQSVTKNYVQGKSIIDIDASAGD